MKKQLIALSIVALALAACGGTGSASSSPDASSEVVGPLIVTIDNANGAPVNVAVGRTVTFDLPTPAGYTLVADPAGVVTLTPGSDDGSAVYLPAMTADMAGSVNVTLTATDGSGTSYLFAFIVE
jgi:ABC-type Fe3+-hydroxamate transport system substrate-binding protein